MEAGNTAAAAAVGRHSRHWSPAAVVAGHSCTVAPDFEDYSLAVQRKLADQHKEDHHWRMELPPKPLPPLLLASQ